MTKLRIAAAVCCCVALGACSSGSSGRSSAPSTSSTTAAAGSTTTVTASAGGARPCGSGTARPAGYSSVIVFSFENRTWQSVGGVGFGAMPYLHALAKECAYFSDFHEGATTPCSASGNAAKHIPALYLWGADDRAHCAEQVRPLTDLHVDALPNFAFVTPTLCNDGHDCPNATVDAWAHDHIQPVIDSAAYRAGHVAVFVWYDEDHPVSNLWITPTATAGANALAGAGAMMGLPCLAQACTAADMRAAANS